MQRCPLNDVEGVESPLRGPLKNVPTTSMERSGSTSSTVCFTYDANGNVSEYVSINGSIVAHYDYSPFGETLIESGDLASSFTHRFSTKPWCPVTRVCEYQMRKYRPEIGRWLSRDSYDENSGEVNNVGFLSNEPLSQIDYLGNIPIWLEKPSVIPFPY